MDLLVVGARRERGVQGLTCKAVLT